MYRIATKTARRRTKKSTAKRLIALMVTFLVGIAAGLAWRGAIPLGPHTVHSATRQALVSAQPLHTYGIAAGSSLTGLSSAQLNSTLGGIAATGATWVRFDFDWSIIQPNSANSFDWAAYDRLVNASQKHHLQMLGILTYTPAWARPAGCTDSQKCHPADPAQFATFAAAVASRYKGSGVHCWEIWNEPNNPSFWAPAADPQAYTALLEQAAQAIRHQDKDSYIITGGLSPQATTATSYAPKAFLSAVYAAGGRDSFDAVGDHPYTFPLSPADDTADDAWTQMASPQSSLRQIMQDNGDAKKIWITEFGAPTGGPGPISTISQPNLGAKPYVVNEELQAKILADAITKYKSYDWVGPFFWYSYRDAGTDPSTNENFFGLLRYDQTEKPAYATFQKAMR